LETIRTSVYSVADWQWIVADPDKQQRIGWSKRLERYGYTDCVMTIDDLIDGSD